MDSLKNLAGSDVSIRRKVTPEVPVHILAWRVMLQEGDAKRLSLGEIFPVTQKKGWSTWTTGPRSFSHDTTNKLAITARVSAGVGAQAKVTAGIL